MMFDYLSRFRTVLVAGTLLAAMVPGANAAPPPEPPINFGPQPLESTVYNGNLNLVPVSIPFYISVAGDYSYGLWTAGFSKLAGASGFLGLTILDSDDVAVGDLSLSVVGPFIGTTKGGTFAVGSYMLQIGAFGTNFRANDVQATFFGNPVPGPIAGAGLPLLLGFAGYAAWRRRAAKAAV